MRNFVEVLLFIEKWPVEGRSHSADAGTSIGRAECDIVLPDPDVSRRHALIQSAAGSFAVEDVGSKNGTFVNGHRIESATVLKRGDEVRFGNTVLRVESAPDPVPQETRLATPTQREETAAAPPSAGAGSRSHYKVDPTASGPVPMAALAPFSPPAPRSMRGSAARRLEATLIAYGVVIATAAAVTVYFIQR